MNELLAASSGRTVTILPVGTEGIKGFPLIHCLVKVYNRNLRAAIGRLSTRRR